MACMILPRMPFNPPRPLSKNQCRQRSHCLWPGSFPFVFQLPYLRERLSSRSFSGTRTTRLVKICDKRAQRALGGLERISFHLKSWGECCKNQQYQQLYKRVSQAYADAWLSVFHIFGLGLTRDEWTCCTKRGFHIFIYRPTGEVSQKHCESPNLLFFV